MALAKEANEQIGLVRKKLLQVFRYLEAFNQLRNPTQREIENQPWTMWMDDLPDHPCIQVGKIGATGEPDEETVDYSDDFILKVRRPELTPVPEPPFELQGWLTGRWRDVDGVADVLPQRIETGREGQKIAILFTDDPERVRLLKQWLQHRDAWVSTERPVRQAMTAFEKLYKLHADLEREAEKFELVVGDGLLSWNTASGVVRHPVLLLRLTMAFQPEIPEFTLKPTDNPPELYSALLRAIPEVNATAIGRCRQDLETGGWHPLGDDDTDSYFRRLVSQLSSKGILVAKDAPVKLNNYPQIQRKPVIFQRSRNQGFAKALEGIIEDINAGAGIPGFMQNVVGFETPDLIAGTGSQPAAKDSPNGEDEDILLSKPANPEQLDIARRLDRRGAVLVQGPPGTGKTHTIANLIGHLLAQGKSVLVTSHTAKALRVLRDKVVEPLQPLCVSAIDDTTDQLEAAIDAISSRLASENAADLEKEADGLVRERREIIRQLRELRIQLKLARMDEYRAIIVGGQEFDPTQAARLVAAEKETSSWIPSPVSLGEPLPLSTAELADLYRTNGSVTVEDEKELGLELPNPDLLLTPQHFTALVQQLTWLEKQDVSHRTDLWETMPKGVAPEYLLDICQQAQDAVEPLGNPDEWRQAALVAGHEGGVSRQAWEDLLIQIEQINQQATAAQVTIFAMRPEIQPNCLPGKLRRVLTELVAHIEHGGTLGWMDLLFKPEWKTVINAAKVKDRKPETADDFRALQVIYELAESRSELVKRWKMQMQALGGVPASELGEEPERICRQLIAPLRQCLDWETSVWAPVATRLRGVGFRFDALVLETPVSTGRLAELERIRSAVTSNLRTVFESRANQLLLDRCRQQLTALVRGLEGASPEGGVRHLLQSAVANRDCASYRLAYDRLVDLYARNADLARRRELLNRLHQVAPSWANAISARDGDHGAVSLPGDPVSAWRWRQLQDELERRASVSIDELQKKISDLTEALHRITARLVEARAWAAQVHRTNLEQRSALTGWKQMIKKAGKRTGKRAPILLAEARKLMPICQTAVPVWIMPLSRVVESFDPLKNRFDVVIIDEASQADVLGLCALYLGRQVVVVGDDEQVSPMAVGTDLSEVQGLIDEHLAGIPQAALYDGQQSIYDLAARVFEPVCLHEHFRSVTPIIQFSNYLSYGGKIKPLRDASEVKLVPYTTAYRVEGYDTRKNVNEEEAQAIVSLILAAISQPEYHHASFGVISMVGKEQADHIDNLLRQRLSTSQYAHHKILCGSPAEFQGDERDVVFLSMIDVPSGKGPLSLRTTGAGDMYKKRYNVAASRARDQLWVVHSLDIHTDLKQDDIRLRLIRHAENPNAITEELDRLEKHVESEFERLVLNRLVKVGYRLTPQWEVGAYRIDMVVESQGKRLAVECDGDRWHSEERIVADMTRQAILERMGWRFVRIRGTQFFRDPERAMEPVFRRLAELGIAPDHESGSEALPEDGGELRERIIREAARIRRQWNGGEEEPIPDVMPIQSNEPKQPQAHTTIRNSADQAIAQKPTRNELADKTQSVQGIKWFIDAKTGLVVDSSMEEARPVQRAEVPETSKLTPSSSKAKKQSASRSSGRIRLEKF